MLQGPVATGSPGPRHPVKSSIMDTNNSAGAWRAAGFKQDSERGGHFYLSAHLL